MNTSQQIKGLLAGVATVALIGTAMAQGSPPNPSTTNAPTGAGQQSTQGTPMGTTGTPAGGGTAAAGASGSGTMGSTTTGTPGSAAAGMPPSAGSAGTAPDTSVASSGRPARADRN